MSSAGGTQEALAEAATNAVKTITSEADHVKLGAAALGSDDMEAQVTEGGRGGRDGEGRGGD